MPVGQEGSDGHMRGTRKQLRSQSDQAHPPADPRRARRRSGPARPDRITIVAAARRAHGRLPTCRRPSGRIHSRYERRLHDLPWQGRPVILRLRARRFRCPDPACPRRTFAERVGHVAPWLPPDRPAGGPAAAGRLGHRRRGRSPPPGRLAMPASPDTLLRLVSGTGRRRARRPECSGWTTGRCGAATATARCSWTWNAMGGRPAADRQAGRWRLAARHPGVEVVAGTGPAPTPTGLRRAPRRPPGRGPLAHPAQPGRRAAPAVERQHAAIRRIGRRGGREGAPSAPRTPPHRRSRADGPERREAGGVARRQARYDKASALAAGGRR